MKVQLVEVKPDKQTIDALHTVLRPANPEESLGVPPSAKRFS